MNLANLEFHELANLFPLMEEESEELRELAEDIQKNGLMDPIVLLDGKVFDGRNRYGATKLLGLKLSADDVIQFEEVFEGEDPFQFVVSKNLHRRHLSTSQRAAVAAEIFKRISPGENGGSSIEERTKDIEQRYRRAATPMQVSPKSVERAVGVMNASPELHEEVHAGTKTLHQATKEVRRKKAENKKVDPQDKDEAQQRILKICGEKFWSEMMKGEVVGLKTGPERVAFAARPPQEMHELSWAMFWGELTLAEALKFKKERLGSKVTKKWRIEELLALMGGETEHGEGVVTGRGCYRVMIEMCTPEAVKREREALASKAGAKRGTGPSG